jgi:hypothetical protein
MGERGCARRLGVWVFFLFGHPAIHGIFLCRTELELKQSQMAQKPILRGEVGARALRVRLVSRKEVLASADVQGACVSEFGFEAD